VLWVEGEWSKGRKEGGRGAKRPKQMQSLSGSCKGGRDEPLPQPRTWVAVTHTSAQQILAPIALSCHVRGQRLTAAGAASRCPRQ
jgi:hypothetical protein